MILALSTSVTQVLLKKKHYGGSYLSHCLGFSLNLPVCFLGEFTMVELAETVKEVRKGYDES